MNAMVNSLLKHKLTHNQLNSFLIEYEARRMGLDTDRIDHKLVICKDSHGKHALFRRAAGPDVGYAADILCMNKDWTKRLLFKNGIPVNPWITVKVNDVPKAIEFCEKHSWQVVLKPTSGFGGRDVFTDISNIEQLKNALNTIHNSKIVSTRYHSPCKILIEKKFVTNDYRFFIVNQRVVAIQERVRPAIIGDGSSSVGKLIDIKKKIRLSNPDLFSRPLVVDDIVHNRLKAANISMNSVLKTGEKFILRGNANLSTGGESVDITEKVSNHTKALVESAVKIIPGLYSCAADVFCVGIYNKKAVDPAKVIINEIEPDAGMCIHHFPMHGKPRNVAKHLLLSAFSNKGNQYPLETNYIHDFDDNEDLVDEIAYSIKNKYYTFFEENKTF